MNKSEKRQGYFKGADIIIPFRKFDKKEICVRQSEMQNTAAKIVLRKLDTIRSFVLISSSLYDLHKICIFIMFSLLVQLL